MDVCRRCKTAHQTHYGWLRDDEVYATDFAIAKEMAADGCEDEVIRRGKEGFERKVGFHQGQWQGTVQMEYSDNLLMFQSKKNNPAYRDNHTVEVTHTHRISADEALSEINALVERNPNLLALLTGSGIELEGDVVEAEFVDYGLDEAGTPPIGCLPSDSCPSSLPPPQKRQNIETEDV